ncbi:MAG: tetratricopeptide repeat protein [Candidatus Hydrogenedentes bacterium]|nr:tetratricopeptide repeat protein [Candidatus Hydrogenedentota bacterium]
MIPPPTNKNKRIVYILLSIILLVALVIRLIYYFQISKYPEYHQLILDPQFNDYWAKKIIHGPSYPSPTGEDPLIEKTPYGRPPGYPYILSIIYFIFGENLQVPRAVQVIIGLLNILLIYRVATDLFHNRITGLISALLLSTLWQTIYFEQEINYPTWVITITIIMIWSFAKYLLYLKPIYLTFTGVILGIFALFRPNALILYFLFLGFVFYKHFPSYQKILRYVLIFTIGVILPLIPVFIRNYMVSKEFFLISCFGGINTYIGNNPYSTGDSPTIPDINNLCGFDNWSCFNYRYLVAGLGIKHRGTPFSFSEASNFFYKKSSEFWKKSPEDAIKLTLRKFFLFWGPHIVSDGKVIQYEIENTILKYLPNFQNLFALFLFSTLCLILRISSPSNRNESELYLFLFLSSILYSSSVIPFFVSERYRVPIIAYMSIFSASLIGNIVENKNYLTPCKKLKIVSLLTLCVIASYVSLASYSPDKSRYLYHKALALYSNSKLEESKNLVLKAIEINPKNHEYYLLLGEIYLQTNEPTEAKIHFLKALEMNPLSPTVHNNLGYMEELEGNLQKARELYTKATSINPVYTLGWINLGRVYLYSLNMPEEAKFCFLKAVEIDPNLWKTWFHLGNSYLVLGEFTKAEEYLSKAINLSPKNPHVLNNLGLVYFKMGNIQKSKDFFEKALSIDSNLPDALFNLGKIYKELSMPKEAKKYFEKILSIQPNYPGVEEELKTLDN